MLLGRTRKIREESAKTSLAAEVPRSWKLESDFREWRSKHDSPNQQANHHGVHEKWRSKYHGCHHQSSIREWISQKPNRTNKARTWPPQQCVPLTIANTSEQKGNRNRHRLDVQRGDRWHERESRAQRIFAIVVGIAFGSFRKVVDESRRKRPWSLIEDNSIEHRALG
jgi:hypothetical protein